MRRAANGGFDDRVSRSTLAEAAAVDVTVPRTCAYMEPTEYVPAAGSPTRTHEISIPAQQAEFIFMDVGAWRRDQYSFGVIYGRHAYLCRYRPNERPSPVPMRAGLAEQFFSALGNRVLIDRWASAKAPDQDFDWD